MHSRQKNEFRSIFSQTPIKTATINNFNFYVEYYFYSYISGEHDQWKEY